MQVGLTGLAQIVGLRGDTSIEQRVKYDNIYIDQWRFTWDVHPHQDCDGRAACRSHAAEEQAVARLLKRTGGASRSPRNCRRSDDSVAKAFLETESSNDVLSPISHGSYSDRRSAAGPTSTCCGQRLAEPEVTEVVVVVDAAGERPDEIEAIDPRVSRLDGEVSGLPGVLRSLGTEAATTDWVAYLDDDDEFLPGKLAAQLALAASQDLEMCPACRSWSMRTVVVERSVPRVPYTTGERLDEYLLLGGP